MADHLPPDWQAEWVAQKAGISLEEAHRFIAATDLMTDDGCPSDTAVRVALAALRTGRDPEATARHFIRLRRAAKASQ